MCVYRGASLQWTPSGPSWLSCIERCPYFKGRFVHSSMWLGLQTVSSLESCMSFVQSVLHREATLYRQDSGLECPVQPCSSPHWMYHVPSSHACMCAGREFLFECWATFAPSASSAVWSGS